MQDIHPKRIKPKSREISFTHSLLPSCQIYLKFLPCVVQIFETIWQLSCHWPLCGEFTGHPHKGPVTRKMFPFAEVIMIATAPDTQVQLINTVSGR